MSLGVIVGRKIEKKSYSYSISGGNPLRYLYNLEIEMIDGEILNVRKIDENRYINLIAGGDDIDYERIVSYKLYVRVILDNDKRKYMNSGRIERSMSFFSNQENNVYIEFKRLNDGKARCICRYIDYNNIECGVSPPY